MAHFLFAVNIMAIGKIHAFLGDTGAGVEE